MTPLNTAPRASSAAGNAFGAIARVLAELDDPVDPDLLLAAAEWVNVVTGSPFLSDVIV